MEIRDLYLDEEYGELDLHIGGRLVDDDGNDRWFTVRVAEQHLVEFDDEGLGRVGDYACRDFIDRFLFGDDCLGIFKVFEEVKTAIRKSMERHDAV